LPKVIKGGIGPSPSSRPAPQAPSTRAAPVPLRPEKRSIIEREVHDAKAEAKQIIAEAEAQAAQILEDAQAQAQTTREEGYKAGYEDGAAQFTETVTRALQEVEAFKAEVEPQYIALVRTCVEKILGQELRLNPDAVVGLVRNALRDATQQREIMVRVHPEDGEHVRKHQRRLMDVLARATNIEVRDDPSVARGGCVVVTELGTIDATLDRQLAAIVAALEEEANAGPGSEIAEEGEGQEEYEEEA
jgi:type III secretion system HrpE/YscL family protein